MHIKSIGERGAFASDSQFGMSYRQWLIGQALMGAEASNINNANQSSMTAADVAEYSIRVADAVIDLLDKERAAR